MDTTSAGVMHDKEYINDSVASQKLITSNYNTFANECVSPVIREGFLSILKEEHDIQADLFCEMQKRGWYQVQPSDMQQLNNVKQKYPVNGSF